VLITRITLRVITGYVTLDYIIIIRKLIFVNLWSERREYFTTYPLKRRSAAELGCFASRARLVLNVLCFDNNLSYGAKGDCPKREEMLAPL